MKLNARPLGQSLSLSLIYLTTLLQEHNVGGEQPTLLQGLSSHISQHLIAAKTVLAQHWRLASLPATKGINSESFGTGRNGYISIQNLN